MIALPLEHVDLSALWWLVPVLFGFSYGTNRSSSRQNSESGTQFPAQFLADYTNLYGRPFLSSDLNRLLPKARGLFDVAPAPSPGAASGSSAAPGDGAARPPAVRLNASYFDLQNNNVTNAASLKALGLDPSNFTLAEYEASGLAARDPNTYSRLAAAAGGRTQLAENFTQPLGVDAPAAGPGVGGQSALDAVSRLRFGALPAAAAPPSVTAPSVVAPNAAAASGTVAPAGYDALQQSLFEQSYAPVAREIQRQGSVADRQLAAQEAASGLATSGAGIGQILRQRETRAAQLQSAATDASNAAVAQRYALQYQEAQANAERQQQANLANAGLGLDAQKTNAANVLAGRSADADNYLKAIGLDQQGAAEARSSFLQLMGLQEADLARVDQASRQNLELMINTYLQNFAAAANAGQFSIGEGKGKASGVQTGIQLSGSGGQPTSS